MLYFLFKTIHVVGFVSWFAGLFYLGRMFVYHAEALEKPSPDREILSNQIALMETRVYSIIMNPAMMITWFCGLSMIYLYGFDWWKANIWMHFKLGLLILLTIYHLKTKSVIKGLLSGKRTMNSFQFRLFNEVPTLFLILIATLAVYKNNTNPLYLILSLVGIVILLYSLTKIYKKIRTKKEVNR